MATLEYSTKDGDVLDKICQDYYGQGLAGGYAGGVSGVNVMQTVLLANPGLAELGTVYRSGVKITLPDIPQLNIKPMYRPWGVVS